MQLHKRAPAVGAACRTCQGATSCIAQMGFCWVLSSCVAAVLYCTANFAAAFVAADISGMLTLQDGKVIAQSAVCSLACYICYAVVLADRVVASQCIQACSTVICPVTQRDKSHALDLSSLGMYNWCIGACWFGLLMLWMRGYAANSLSTLALNTTIIDCHKKMLMQCIVCSH